MHKATSRALTCKNPFTTKGKVTEFKVELEKQEVNVTGPVEYDELLERIKKTGKQVSERMRSGSN